MLLAAYCVPNTPLAGHLLVSSSVTEGFDYGFNLTWWDRKKNDSISQIDVF